MLIRVKDAIIGIFVLVSFGILVSMVYHYEIDKGHRDLAKRIIGVSSKGGPPETIEGLKQAIALYEKQIELNVKIGAQTGVYWKILAIRLADKKMHNEALQAFERALYYKGDDPTIFYLTGESASIAAANTLDFKPDSASERQRLLNLAESAYLRAIELDPTYAKPKLGLGILYTFDMDRAADAIPHLDRYIQINSRDASGMFVLARAYFMTGENDRAIDLYNRIISRSKDPKVKAEAKKNIEMIRDMM